MIEWSVMNRNFPSTGFHGTATSLFGHQELRQILSAYSEGVFKKNWRDYAIASEPSQTTFCVVNRGNGSAPSVLYSISKQKSRKQGNDYFYRQICQTNQFLEALSVFRGEKNSKNNKLNLVR
jgi:hypothetical protein